MKLVAILLLIALLVMVVSPLFEPARVAMRAARSAVPLLGGLVALALRVVARSKLFARAWRRGGSRALSAKPPLLPSVPVTDLDCVRLC